MSHLKGSTPSSEKPEKEVEPAAPAYSAFKTTFASISLYEGDCIRILQFPQKEIDALREVIKQSWVKGIQKEHLIYTSCYEFKLRGDPWNASAWTGSESIPSRILMREIFAYLFSVGWILHARNNDALIFRQQLTSPPECNWISVTFHGNDRLRLIGASVELIASFRDMLKSMELLQDEFWKEKENNAWEFKIKGRPWLFFGEDMVKGSLLLLKIVETLETHGWSSYSNTTLHLSVQSGVISFSNGWFFVKDKQWVPGMTAVCGGGNEHLQK
jgi:hypothetical protein